MDLGTSLQVLVPLPKTETGELLRDALRDRWIAWSGPPQKLVVDPSQPNLSQTLGDFCNNHGVDLQQTAADAHWQLGKVERHGQWFQRILSRILDEMRPQTEQDWLSCVFQAQSAKNSLLTEAGASPFQLVFGRNPRVPTDLLQESPHTPASDAAELDDIMSRANAIRQAARRAVLECQDDRALRAALRARPRVARPFQSGDWVYYWRTQKSVQGVRFDGGRWYGAAMVLGHIGRNLVVAHRRSLLRCAPEQLRLATPDEATVAEFPHNELLGIKNLLEKGQFPKSQFEDLTQLSRPPDATITERDREVNSADASPTALNAAQILEQARDEPSQVFEPVRATVSDAPSGGVQSQSSHLASAQGTAGADSYGPVRRVTGKTRPDPTVGVPLVRLPDTQPDDFLEMMSEVVPRMIAQQLGPGGTQTVSRAEPSTASSSHQANAPNTLSPRRDSQKREASQDVAEPRASGRRRTESIEDLFCEEVLSVEPSHCSHVEQLMAAFLQKRAQKELPVTGNPPELQGRINEAKGLEWETISGKQAVRVWTGKQAEEIKAKHSDRFIGSRFVVTNKCDEDGERIKARWCLQGHNDPDFHEKILSGECHSPTLSQLARAILLQLLVSRRWVMNLGDIKGAFLEAGPIPEKYRPLYANQPPGGIPGLPPNAVIEILGNLYGANNAPSQWYREFDSQARAAGFVRSMFDPCLYYYRHAGSVTGVLGAHVDDTITGGEGDAYNRAIDALRKRFPYRKWRTGTGEFCGTSYAQDPKTFEITYQQETYAKHLRPIRLSKERQRYKDSLATPEEVRALRAVNGAANWLSSQTRPDLCVQTSFSQQAFPQPTVKDLMFANQLVHRARQHADVSVTVRHIPWSELCIVFHSDAGFANAAQSRTQAGYILAFTDKNLDSDRQAPWSPVAWKSMKLPRVVASTLAGETQVFSLASGLAEYVALMIAEINDGCFDLRKCESHLRSTAITGITDCKSLFDALHSPSSPSKVEDKRVAIDLSIIRQCMERTGLDVRWCPTELMLADALTKDLADPSDLLRTILIHGKYQLSEEASVLALKKEQRDRRAARRRPASHTEASPTPVCKIHVGHNAQEWLTPDPTIGLPLRRVSIDKASGRVLENRDLTRHDSAALEKPCSVVSCLQTEIWYQPHTCRHRLWRKPLVQADWTQPSL